MPAHRAKNCLRSAALTLCLITDRGRLVAQLGAIAWERALLAQIEGAVAGGIDVVQIRERGLDDGRLARFVERAVALTAGTTTQVLVNDRLDVALAAGAHGVHLRETSIAIDAARRLAPRGFVVGRSVHSPASAVNLESADYMITGSVFETSSKPGAPASLGLDGLAAVVRAVKCPVWAVGGVTVERAADIIRCGVAGVAAIGAFIPSGRVDDLAGFVRRMTESMRFSFDSPVQLP